MGQQQDVGMGRAHWRHQSALAQWLSKASAWTGCWCLCLNLANGQTVTCFLALMLGWMCSWRLIDLRQMSQGQPAHMIIPPCIARPMIMIMTTHLRATSEYVELVPVLLVPGLSHAYAQNMFLLVQAASYVAALCKSPARVNFGRACRRQST